jgi:hypothetical protein
MAAPAINVDLKDFVLNTLFAPFCYARRTPAARSHQITAVVDVLVLAPDPHKRSNATPCAANESPSRTNKLRTTFFYGNASLKVTSNTNAVSGGRFSGDVAPLHQGMLAATDRFVRIRRDSPDTCVTLLRLRCGP